MGADTLEVDSFSRTPNNLGAMETFCCFDGSPWVLGVARNSVWSEPAGPDGFAVVPATILDPFDNQRDSRVPEKKVPQISIKMAATAAHSRTNSRLNTEILRGLFR